MALAKTRGAEEVSCDDLLRGCLFAISRFGVAKVGPWKFDLVSLGLDWVNPPETRGVKVTYSDEVVEIFDRAANIARADSYGTLGLEHMLVAFADEKTGLMGKLKREFQIDSASWRAAVADLSPAHRAEQTLLPVQGTPREYLTPEEAALALNIHVQTVRAYVRSSKLPALRLAGERAIRIRCSDLEKVLEPLIPEK
jgi:excisionase family DNA binding protein